ncbi:Threonine/homoserine efflux transporter RhtA [Alkalispirochaeta americana]|uniref:Threonine/homoserine efflux transporter RhtA n=1 Tax=Alkalispirochaeta americana TaxID=159291 RepID=A0A1N6N7V4_9SPIO|nr:DMT family transporter [Alkalispirochaeta americana]SIP88132.1 Threonine/homoserine efflux transporter RhtA [Alkalispirochaeta americana]
MKSRLFFNDTLLLLTAAIWGFAFVAQRLGMDHVGPFFFTGVRFLLGALVLLPVALLRARPSRRVLVLLVPGAALTGLVLFAGSALQQIGLVYTTAGNAGFITGLYVVMVPVLGVFRRQTVGGLRWGAVGLAVVGLYLLSVQRGVSVNPGDLLVMGSAFFFALHVQLIDHLSRRYPVLWISLVQYGVVALVSLAVAAVLEPVNPAGLRGAAIPILYGGVGSIAIAYTLQTVAQRRATPSHAAILLSLEGSFAALGGWLILSEVLSVRAALGCGLLLSGMVLSQVAGFRRGALPRQETLPSAAS